MDKSIINTLDKVFGEMPMQFSSKFFCKKCRTYGVSDVIINNNLPSKYLSQKAKVISRGVWSKSYAENYNQNNNISKFEESYLQTMISTLKEHGYKVMKQTTTYEEV